MQKTNSLNAFVPLGKIQLEPLEPFTDLYTLPIRNEKLENNKEYFMLNTEGKRIEIDPMINDLEVWFNYTKYAKTIKYKPELGIYRQNNKDELESSEPQLNILKNIDLTEKNILNPTETYAIGKNLLYTSPTINIFAKLHREKVSFFSDTKGIEINHLFELQLTSHNSKDNNYKPPLTKGKYQKISIEYALNHNKENIYLLLYLLSEITVEEIRFLFNFQKMEYVYKVKGYFLRKKSKEIRKEIVPLMVEEILTGEHEFSIYIKSDKNYMINLE